MTDEQQNIQNDAPNQGAQGQFHGDVNTGTQQDVSGERAVGIGGDANAPVTTGDGNIVVNIIPSGQRKQTPNLVLDDLGIESPLWERDHYLRFTISNPGSGILFVDRLSLKVLRATPCNMLKPPCEGAILKMFEFEINLRCDKTDYLISEDFFVYKSGDIDGFRIKLTSNQDYTYDIQVEVEWHNVDGTNRQQALSKIHSISFYPQDIDAAMTILNRRENTNF